MRRMQEPDTVELVTILGATPDTEVTTVTGDVVFTSDSYRTMSHSVAPTV